MLPHSFELPAAILLLLGGALSCFAGHRLFKVVLGVYGFILGANVASSMMGASNTTGMVVSALVGGLAGALILVFAYFVGIALVGAGLGALVAHVGWNVLGGDPPALLVIALAILGAVGAMLLQRYVIVVSTAFGGAWTMLLGVLAMFGDRASGKAAQVGDVWILYPTAPATDQRWLPVAWIVLGLVGTAVQLGVTGKKKK